MFHTLARHGPQLLVFWLIAGQHLHDDLAIHHSDLSAEYLFPPKKPRTQKNKILKIKFFFFKIHKNRIKKTQKAYIWLSWDILKRVIESHSEVKLELETQGRWWIPGSSCPTPALLIFSFKKKKRKKNYHYYYHCIIIQPTQQEQQKNHKNIE